MEYTQDAKTIRKDIWKNIIKGNDKGEINPLHVCNPIEFWWFKNLAINACTVCTRLLKIPQEWIWLFHHTGSYTFYTVSWCMWLKFVPKWMNKLLHVMDHWSPFSSVQSLSRVRLFVTPWIAAHQASLSITNSRSLLKLMSIELVMPSSHLILCRPLLLLPPILLSIRVFSNESTLRMRWPKYWSFNFSVSPSNEHPGLISVHESLRSS